MAGSQVLIAASCIEKQRLGYQAISLTNFASDTDEPAIAAGSKVEIGDALFEFASDESITGWSGIAVSSDVYIHLTVSGSSVTASFSITAPTWDDAKQGWYSGAVRVVGGLYKDGSGNYALKWLYPADPGDPINQEMLRSSNTRPLLKKELDIGDWNMDSTPQINVAHGLVLTKIKSVCGTIRNDADSSHYQIPSPKYTDGTGDEMGLWVASVNSTNVVLYRQNTTQWDSNYFDSTSYNRGWLTIEFRA